MSDLRVLTDAELDFVSGGQVVIIARPAPRPEAPIVKLVEEIIVDILKVLEGNNGRQKAYTAAA
jgi:hypothetical protein